MCEQKPVIETNPNAKPREPFIIALENLIANMAFNKFNAEMSKLDTNRIILSAEYNNEIIFVNMSMKFINENFISVPERG